MKMMKIILSLVAALLGHAAFAVGPAPAPMKQKETLTVGFVKVGHLSPMLMIEEELKKLNIEVKRAEFVRYAESLAMSQPTFDPLARALALARDIAGRNPHAVRAAKALFNLAPAMGFAGVLLAVLSGVVAAARLGVSTETDLMFSESLPWRRHVMAMKKDFPRFFDLIVAVIDAREPEFAEETAAAAEQAEAVVMRG